MFIGIELVLDTESLTPAPNQATYVANRMRECNILISTGKNISNSFLYIFSFILLLSFPSCPFSPSYLYLDGPFHNVLKIKPPLVFNKDNVDYFVQTLDKILDEDYCILRKP